MSEPRRPDPTADPADPTDPLVRPYVMTSGRGRPDAVRLDMISVVIAARAAVEETGLEPEQLEILSLCEHAKSVAEVSAHLSVPVAVVKVLVGDLIGRGYVLARAPYTSESPVSRDVLRAVLDGIERL